MELNDIIIVEYYLMFLVFASGANAFILLIAHKYNIADTYNLHRRRWMPEWCDPCACFWLAVIAALLTLVLFPGLFIWYYLLLTAPATAAYTLYILR